MVIMMMMMMMMLIFVLPNSKFETKKKNQVKQSTVNATNCNLQMVVQSTLP